MVAKAKLQGFISATSILMFLLSFLTRYLGQQADLTEAFIHGVVSFVVATLVLKAIYFVWRHSFTAKEWRIMIDGHAGDDDEDELDLP